MVLCFQPHCFRTTWLIGLFYSGVVVLCFQRFCCLRCGSTSSPVFFSHNVVDQLVLCCGWSSHFSSNFCTNLCTELLHPSSASILCNIMIIFPFYANLLVPSTPLFIYFLQFCIKSRLYFHSVFILFIISVYEANIPFMGVISVFFYFFSIFSI